MARQLRALIALAQGLASIPSPYMVAHACW